MSAGLSRATTRQNTQPSVNRPSRDVYNTGRSIILPAEESRTTHGHVPQVQAADPEEREPHQARHGLGPQDVPEPARPRQAESVAARVRVLVASDAAPPSTASPRPPRSRRQPLPSRPVASRAVSRLRPAR